MWITSELAKPGHRLTSRGEICVKSCSELDCSSEGRAELVRDCRRSDCMATALAPRRGCPQFPGCAEAGIRYDRGLQNCT